MRETTTRGTGLAFFAVAYMAFVGWLFVRQPQTMAQVTGGLSAAVGAYHVDSQALADGLRFFRNDQFVEARLAFARADPAQSDAQTQFYIAYSYYRQDGDASITTIVCTPTAWSRSIARSRSRLPAGSWLPMPTSPCTPRTN